MSEINWDKLELTETKFDDMNSCNACGAENSNDVTVEDINICPFKKHAGKTWIDVVKTDKDYCHWLLDGWKIRNPAMVELVRGLM